MEEYQKNVQKWKEAYKEILEVCNKYPDFNSVYGFDDINQMKASAMNHLELIRWYGEFGIKESHDYKPYERNHIDLRDGVSFSYFRDAEQEKESGKGGKYISWSDDDRQPNNEWLFILSYSTGAYIFGEDYNGQKQLFQDFWKELKTYNPDYIDSHNSCLYWKLSNAKVIHETYTSILNKYRDRNKAELKQREIQKLRDKLNKLEGEPNQ